MLRLALSMTLGCLLALAGVAAGEKSRRLGGEDAKALTGTWRLVKGELGGQTFPIDEKNPTTLEISGDHYTVTTGEGKDEGTTRLFPDKSPKAMDVMGTKGPNAGKTFLAIYELKGDRLRVCYDLAGKDRPRDFKTAEGSKVFLAEYERVKR